MKKLILTILAVFTMLTLLACGCQSCQSCKSCANTENKLKIEFIIDNELYSTVYVKFGSAITPPEVQERENYVFKGWYLTNEYSAKWNFSTEVAKDNLKLYGFWIAEENDYYNVLFYDNSTLLKREKVNKGERIDEYIPNEKEGYKFIGWKLKDKIFDFETEIYEDISLTAVWELRQYTVSFIADGKVIKECSYTVENKEISIPSVPEKEYYTGKWESFEIKTGNFDVKAIYTPIAYTATFVVDNSVIKTIDYTVEDDIVLPDIPNKKGYTGSWAGFPSGGDVTIEADYLPITYTLKFVVFDELLTTIQYTIEDEITLPEVPEFTGYSGVWEDFEPASKLELTVNAHYNLIKYKATFIAEDVIVATEYFTIDNMRISEPPVPEKPGYVGKWAPYELELKDIVIKAIYTPV